LTKRAGGKGANQAYALAQAGGNVTLDGNVGKDGEWVKEMLGKNGVDVTRVGVIDEEVGRLALIWSDLTIIGDWKSSDSASCRWGEFYWYATCPKSIGS